MSYVVRSAHYMVNIISEGTMCLSRYVQKVPMIFRMCVNPILNDCVLLVAK